MQDLTSASQSLGKPDRTPLTSDDISHLSTQGHELVRRFDDKDLGFRAIIAVHRTAFNRSLGGCRMHPYSSEEEALDDVLRLSHGMSLKNALAGLPFGGAKGCIIMDPIQNGPRRKEILRRFGDCVDSFGGKYITAEDMGTTVDDIEIVRERTPHVCCISRAHGGVGDPSPWTAQGVLQGMRAALESTFGKDDFRGRVVALQGLGKVGGNLAQLLVESGAHVIASDIDQERLRDFQTRLGIETVPLEEIYDVPCDIFSPCARGQTINGTTVPRLNCRIVAGAANNQLSHPEVGREIKARGILYCPDFAINAGGVIAAASEFDGQKGTEWVADKVNGIYGTIKTIIAAASVGDRTPESVAVELAEQKLSAGGMPKNVRLYWV